MREPRKRTKGVNLQRILQKSLYTNTSLIKNSEHPQRDACAITGFDAGNSQIAVGDAGDLIEFFAFATDLEQVFPIHQEITLMGYLNCTDSGKLVDEESLPECADVNLGRKGVHQIGVAKVDLLWIYQLFITLEFYGKKLQNLGLIQIVKEFQQGIPRRTERGGQPSHIGL